MAGSLQVNCSSWIAASSENGGLKIWTVEHHHQVSLLRALKSQFTFTHSAADEATHAPWQPVGCATPFPCSSDHKKECLRLAEFLLWNFLVVSASPVDLKWSSKVIRVAFRRCLLFNNGCCCSSSFWTIVCFPNTGHFDAVWIYRRHSTVTARCLEWTVGKNSKKKGANPCRYAVLWYKPFWFSDTQTLFVKRVGWFLL